MKAVICDGNPGSAPKPSRDGPRPAKPGGSPRVHGPASSRAPRPRLGLDADQLAVAGLAELDLAGLEREEREVAAHADVLAGVEERPDLANDDVARRDLLAREALDATPLRLRVATVAGA